MVEKWVTVTWGVITKDWRYDGWGTLKTGIYDKLDNCYIGDENVGIKT